MSLLISWTIAATIAIFAIAKANNEKWPRKFPMNFRSLMDKQELCESEYGDYENCDDLLMTSLAKQSQGLNDLYEYNSGETSLEKIIGDTSDVIEKRARRPGCDCQLSSELVDNGAFTYPRYVRNVTCGSHNHCQHSRPKGLHCLPIYYEVSVLRKRGISDDLAKPSRFPIPKSLRWRAESIQVVVGCVCGRRN